MNVALRTNECQTKKFNLIDFILKVLDAQRFLTIQFDITNACNLSCTHCYHPNHSNRGALSYENWLQIIDQYEGLLKKLRLKPDIIFCGGEPFGSKLLPKLIEEVNTRWPGVCLTILTNGTYARHKQGC